MLLGGFGFLSRLYGLSIDNLVEVEMVLADGRIVIVNNEEYPGQSTCV
jgi:FAD/FMN-containing dehydrogenase